MKRSSLNPGPHRLGPRYPGAVQREYEAPSASPELEAGAPLRRARHSLVRSADLLHALAESDMRVRYGRSFWRLVRWLLDPVALVGVYLLLIVFVLDQPGNAPGLSLTCAVVPFQLVMLSVGNALGALEIRRPILLNMRFRRMLIPVSSALTESVGFAASFLLLVTMMAIYEVPPTWSLLWLPLILAVNLTLAAAAAYPAALFGVWFPELKPFLLSFVRMLFFLGPGLVPLNQTREGVANILRLNPLTGLFEAYRDVFLFGKAPAAWQLVYPLVAAGVLLAVFVPVFRSEQRQFAKVL